MSNSAIKHAMVQFRRQTMTAYLSLVLDGFLCSDDIVFKYHGRVDLHRMDDLAAVLRKNDDLEIAKLASEHR